MLLPLVLLPVVMVVVMPGPAEREVSRELLELPLEVLLRLGLLPVALRDGQDVHVVVGPVAADAHAHAPVFTAVAAVVAFLLLFRHVLVAAPGHRGAGQARLGVVLVNLLQKQMSNLFAYRSVCKEKVERSKRLIHCAKKRYFFSLPTHFNFHESDRLRPKPGPPVHVLLHLSLVGLRVCLQ